MLAGTIYADGLASNWNDWSWDTTRSFSATDPVQSGSNAIAAEYDAGWAGLYLRASSAVTMQPSEEIRFFLHGGSGGQSLQVKVVLPDESLSTEATLTPAAGVWTEVVIDYPNATAPASIVGIIWQDATGAPVSSFSLDQIEIGDFATDGGGTGATGPTITIDANQVVRQISDEIYGLNFADPSLASTLDLPVNRWGGNATSRYNYLLDTTNLASDFFFENSPGDASNANNLPASSSANDFVRDNQSRDTESIITVGMLGWTPNGRNQLGSFPVDVYGAQQSVNMYRPNNGNGIDLNGNPIVNDPLITSTAVDETFVGDWVSHLVSEHGTAANGGVQYYALDNEPMLWNATHRDVHPTGASYDEVLNKGILYADAIKSADPTAKTLGPTVWGWTAYFYSALDQAAGGAWWENPTDRNAHGGQAFLPWYLQEMAAAETALGKRLLDYLDIHFYPQETGIALTTAGDAQKQMDRLESTRALWDPTYTDNSWINTQVQLIPRMRDWIDTYYPGTRLAITEYNWGGVEHLNGALTQADILGIFGREGVDLATMWDPPEPNEPTANAFRMYRNYDGMGTDGSRFGESSLLATTTDVDLVSVFAAQRASDNAVTVVLINKSTQSRTTPVQLAGDARDFSAERYTYDASNLDQIVAGADQTFTSGATSIELPASSITLLEIPAANLPCDYVGNGDGCDISDLDALYAGTDGAPAPLTNQAIAQWLQQASATDNPLKGSPSDVYVLGDTNLDGKVDSTDLGRLLNNFSSGSSIGWSGGNLNSDAQVNSQDLGLLLNRFGYTSPTASAASDRVFASLDLEEDEDEDPILGAADWRMPSLSDF